MENQDSGAQDQNRFIPPKDDFIYGPDPHRLLRLRDTEKEKEQEEDEKEFYDIFRKPPSPRFQLPDDSYFYLMVTGQIESAENNNADEITAQYNFEAGGSWEQIAGATTGSSQLAWKSGGIHRRIVFNFPFEIGYRSTNPKGWPQMVVTLIGPDFYGRNVPKGYGNVHIPTTPGRHVRYMSTYVPESSSLLIKFIGWLKGRPAEYSDPIHTLTGNAGREVTRVNSHGKVKIVFVVAEVNMKKFGY